MNGGFVALQRMHPQLEVANWLHAEEKSGLSTNLCIETVDWAIVYLESNLPLSLARMDNPHFSVSVSGKYSIGQTNTWHHKSSSKGSF